ncbi:hypothetical protein HMPREF9148_02243 [Prevotella sp. F0091]|nr:hypothetical protein HMPREF9148_02243 [Prevotella sp. F0091]
MFVQVLLNPSRPVRCFEIIIPFKKIMFEWNATNHQHFSMMQRFWLTSYRNL